jgi:hypothetical protein
MKKSVIALAVCLAISNNNYTNSKIKKDLKKEITTSEIIKKIKANEELKLQNISINYIKKYNLKGNFTRKDILKIRYIANKLKIEEEWLYKLFYLESRGNPKAINKNSGAVGLIQFMPSTAKNLNTSAKEILKMSIFEQLEYVYKYLIKIKGNTSYNSFLDLYFAVFYPSAINKSDSYILGKNEVHAKKIAKYNKGIDKAGNNDGIITVSDVRKWTS